MNLAEGKGASRVACRQCRSLALEDLGTIPPADVFAGQPLVPPWDGGSLYRCSRCRLVFRHAIRADDEYERLYETASQWIWVSEKLRCDQRLVLARVLAERHTGSVLDVGCYDGTLLAALGGGFQRFGIEASTAAARSARERGIEIVGAKISEVGGLARRFDVVCAVDVIEHVAQPRDFLALLAARLLPGGSLVVSTGNADAWPFRAAGGRYWYACFPEHLSFISPGWLDATVPALGLEVVGVQRFAYGETTARERLRERLRYARKLGRDRLLASISTSPPARWFAACAPKVVGRPGIFEDHMVVTLKRTAALT